MRPRIGDMEQRERATSPILLEISASAGISKDLDTTEEMCQKHPKVQVPTVPVEDPLLAQELLHAERRSNQPKL